MRIAFIHFHLKTGGVTSVIARQVEAVRKFGGQAVILSGEPPARPMGCNVIVIPQLAYDQPGRQTERADTVARRISTSLEDHWPGGPDVVHVHNPTLSKNRRLQAVLKCLQHSGCRLLCQIHDFAEDGRPDFFFNEEYVADCHYAVLNRRDYDLLRSAGLKAPGLHLLSNPIVPLPKTDAAQSGSDDGEILYPVRAIRRKNIGEALLLSCYFDPPATLAVTLPPNSPADCISYAQWRSFVLENDLKARFDAGLKADFNVLVARCRYVLTTSVSEGFGFTFLEPWTVDKPLWGRLLPDICADFIEKGLVLDSLYERLSVPLDFFNHRELCRRWQSAWCSAAVRFGIAVAPDAVQSEWQEISAEGMIDFGLLDERAQRQVIAHIIVNSDRYELLQRLNPFLERPGPPHTTASDVNFNRLVVARHYSLESYTLRLHDVYESIISRGMIRHSIDKGILARAFLAPRTFSLLKWGSFDAQA